MKMFAYFHGGAAIYYMNIGTEMRQNIMLQIRIWF